MAKAKDGPPRANRAPAGKPRASAPEARTGRSGGTKDGYRETVESIAIAFILAFLFRTFEAEAFVIPTGSMAPTLLGYHKDLVCPECGFRYRASASEEDDDDAKRLQAQIKNPKSTPQQKQYLRALLEDKDVVSCTCPVCRFTMSVDPSTPEGKKYLSYKGDRILVAKFPYEFADPQRWDVAVFRYPETAKQNYIKRIVGLPNEVVVLQHGDVFTRPLSPGGDHVQPMIERKPPDKVRAMLQVVHDNDYERSRLIDAGWPVRWQAVDPSAAGSWQAVEEGRAFQTDGTARGETWLAYRHFVPPPEIWEKWARGMLSADDLKEAQPGQITDFYAYNARELRRSERESDQRGGYWVGDLAVECDFGVEGAGGEAVVALVEGGRLFQCRFDLGTGKATFSISGSDAFQPTAETAVRGPGTYRVMFANVDDQLLLWVDGDVVEFDGRYENLNNHGPTDDDSAPVRIGAHGAALTVDHLRVLRDIYYTPNRARYFYRAGTATDNNAVEFPLDAGQYLVLGDNSPRSKDSRLWEGRDDQGHIEHYVRRDLLVGKALCVYWPHAWETPYHIELKVWGFKLRLPFYPNFERMLELVR